MTCSLETASFVEAGFSSRHPYRQPFILPAVDPTSYIDSSLSSETTMLQTPATVTKVAAPPPASSQHVFHFNAWDGRWTDSILRLPMRVILEGLNLATQVIPGNGHCLISSLLVGLQIPVTTTAAQQLRELK